MPEFTFALTPLRPISADLLPWLCNLDGDLLAVLDGVDDYYVEEELGGHKVLHFRLPLSDPKTALLQSDYPIVHHPSDYVYRLTKKTEVHDRSGVYMECECEGLYIELSQRQLAGLTFTDLPLGEGLDILLTGPRWATGTVDFGAGDPDELNDADWTDASVMTMLRDWVALFDLEIEFDALTRKVNVAPAVGRASGLTFRYGENVLAVQRHVVPPSVTRIYPKGKNGINIRSVNSGFATLTDETYYTDLGVDPDVLSEYRKIMVWRDERFVSADRLKRAALRKLAALSVPTVSYEATVVDLAAITGGQGYRIGDTLRVVDEAIDVDAEARVVALKQYPLDPKSDEVEIGFYDSASHFTSSSAAGTGAGSGSGGIRPAAVVVAPFDCLDITRADIVLRGENDTSGLMRALKDAVASETGADIIILDGNVNLGDYAILDANVEHPIEGDNYTAHGKVRIACSPGTRINVDFDYGPWTLEMVETETPPDGYDPGDAVQAAQAQRAIYAFQGYSPITLLSASWFVDHLHWGDLNYGLDRDPLPEAMSLIKFPVAVVNQMTGGSLRAGGSFTDETSMASGSLTVTGCRSIGQLRAHGVGFVTCEDSVPVVFLASYGLQCTLRNSTAAAAAVAEYVETVLMGNLLVIAGIAGTGAGPYYCEVIGNTLGDNPPGDETTPDPFGAALELHGMTAGNVFANTGSIDPDLTVLWIDDACTDIIVAGLNVPSGIRMLDEGTGTVDLDAGGGGGPLALDDLTDVDVPTPTDGDVLTWDAGTSSWVDTAPTGGVAVLDDVGDVDVPTPADGDVLTWDDGTSTWIAVAPTGGGVALLDDVGDVNAPTPTDQYVLTWDDGAGEWIAQAAPGAAGGLGIDSSLITFADTLLGIGPSFTAVNWLSETVVGSDIDFDSGVSPNTVTILTSGIYTIDLWLHEFNPDGSAYEGGLRFAPSAGLTLDTPFPVTGVGTDAFDSSSGVQCECVKSITRWFDASDTFQISAYMDTAATFNVTDGVLHVQRVG